MEIIAIDTKRFIYCILKQKNETYEEICSNFIRQWCL